VWCRRIQTAPNRVEKFKLFVYHNARLEEHDDGPALVVRIEPTRAARTTDKSEPIASTQVRDATCHCRYPLYIIILSYDASIFFRQQGPFAAIPKGGRR
jgi:hypothetical protein